MWLREEGAFCDLSVTGLKMPSRRKAVSISWWPSQSGWVAHPHSSPEKSVCQVLRLDFMVDFGFSFLFFNIHFEKGA